MSARATNTKLKPWHKDPSWLEVWRSYDGGKSWVMVGMRKPR